MKSVYVILSCTNTVPSRFIRITTGAKFTHASLAMTPCRHELYSFARRKMYNFLVGGFVHEDIDAFVFAKHRNSSCAVYEITVSDTAYEKMLKKLNDFEQKYSKYKYNFLGALTSLLSIRQNLKYRYTCSQFVATLLSCSEEITLPKHPSLIKPIDLDDLPNSRLIYSGQIKNISFDKKTNSYIHYGG